MVFVPHESTLHCPAYSDMMPAIVLLFNRLEKRKNRNKFGEFLTIVLLILLSHCLMVQGRPFIVRVVSHWKNFQMDVDFSFTGTVNEVSALLNQRVFLLLPSLALGFCYLS